MSRTLLRMLMLSLGLSAMLCAQAQMGPGMGGGMGGGMTGMGPGMQAGQGGPGMKGGGRGGMKLLTPEERQAHRQKMRSLKTLEECQTYVAEHHKLIVDRATAQGLTPPVATADPCGRMKARGLIK